MVILGLGSNVGDRFAHLRNGLAALKKLANVTIQQVSPVYLSDALLPENAPPEWDMPHLNIALRAETTLEPLALLDALKQIEWSIGRKPEVRHWGPRILDIDILAWDDRIIRNDRLTVPHENLPTRPFALWPLADVAPHWVYPLPGDQQGKTAVEMSMHWGSRFSGAAPLHTQQLMQRIDTAEWVGVLNITPDSFSDGGEFFSADNAIERAKQLVKDGAEIIDVGAESTAPHAPFVSEEEEWKRLEPVLAALKSACPHFLIPPKISLDTRHASVVSRAKPFNIDWINDTSGLQDEALCDLLKHSEQDVVLMHHLSIPASVDAVLPTNLDVVAEMYHFGEREIARLEQAGIARSRIIFDPGIGFGKTPTQSLTLIKHAAKFKALGVRVMVGHSRKSFLSFLTDKPAKERDSETAAISLFLADKVDYLRVHDPAINARMIKTYQFLV